MSPSRGGGGASGGGGGADGRKPVAPAAVAVRQGDGSWAVRYVFDEPLWASAGAAPLWGSDILDEASLGERSVVVTNREGLVLARGTVQVTRRPEGTERSARFDYFKAKRAATRLQAIYRGKHLRGRRKAAQPLPSLGPALGNLIQAAMSASKSAGGAGAGGRPAGAAERQGAGGGVGGFGAGGRAKGATGAAPSTPGKGGAATSGAASPSRRGGGAALGASSSSSSIASRARAP